MTHQIFDIIQSCFGSSVYWLLKHQSLEALCWPRWGEFYSFCTLYILESSFFFFVAVVLKALCCCHSPDNMSVFLPLLV